MPDIGEGTTKSGIRKFVDTREVVIYVNQVL